MEATPADEVPEELVVEEEEPVQQQAVPVSPVALVVATPTTPQQQTPPQPTLTEDTPLRPGIVEGETGHPQTFAELVERELRATSAPISAPAVSPRPHHEFLRRGTGPQAQVVRRKAMSPRKLVIDDSGQIQATPSSRAPAAKDHPVATPTMSTTSTTTTTTTTAEAAAPTADAVEDWMSWNQRRTADLDEFESLERQVGGNDDDDGGVAVATTAPVADAKPVTRVGRGTRPQTTTQSQQKSTAAAGGRMSPSGRRPTAGRANLDSMFRRKTGAGSVIARQQQPPSLTAAVSTRQQQRPVPTTAAAAAGRGKSRATTAPSGVTPNARSDKPSEAGGVDVAAATTNEASELEELMAKYKTANKRLEAEQKALAQQRAAFEAEKQALVAEKARFEQFKTEELQKIRKERKRVDDLRKTSATDRDTREKLSEQVRSDEEQLRELREHVSKLQLTIDNLRRSINDLTHEKSELIEQLRTSEQRALSLTPRRAQTTPRQQPPAIAPAPTTVQPAPRSPQRQQRASTSTAAVQGRPKSGGMIPADYQRDVEELLAEDASVRVFNASELDHGFTVDDSGYPLAGGPDTGDVEVARDSEGDGEKKKTVQRFKSGRTLVHFTNGTIKETLPSGHSCIWFKNGDVKQTFPDDHYVYHYRDRDVTHTSTLIAGEMVYHYGALGQIERCFADNSRHVLFPGGTRRVLLATGEQITVDANGVRTATLRNGTATVTSFPTGVKEIVCRGKLVRIEADGSMTIRDYIDDGNSA